MSSTQDFPIDPDNVFDSTDDPDPPYPDESYTDYSLTPSGQLFYITSSVESYFDITSRVVALS